MSFGALATCGPAGREERGREKTSGKNMRVVRKKERKCQEYL